MPTRYNILWGDILICPYCGSSKMKVIDKRSAEKGLSNRRRRVCLKCGRRFTTYERVECNKITVIKKDGSNEPFDENKLRNGIEHAFEKRPMTKDGIDKIVDGIIQKIRRYKNHEIKSSKIGELIIKKLKSIDKVAYLRFASVYKSFDDTKDFEKEIKTLR